MTRRSQPTDDADQVFAHQSELITGAPDRLAARRELSAKS
jgi:hypothetical protein